MTQSSPVFAIDHGRLRVRFDVNLELVVALALYLGIALGLGAAIHHFAPAYDAIDRLLYVT